MKFSTIEEYIAAQPDRAKVALKEMESIIRRVIPEAEGVISYNMPAFRYAGILVYYAAHKEHLGFYPANVNAIEAFYEDLSDYVTSKGTIRFPLDKEIPHDLVEKILCYRKIQNVEKAHFRKRNGRV